MKKMYQNGYRVFAGVVCGWAMLLMATIAPAQNLYVACTSINIILTVTPNGTLQTNITAGINVPNGMAFDIAGDLFVANIGNNNIVEFTNFNGTLTTNVNVFAAGLHNPCGLAFDSAGDLFEADNGDQEINKFTNQNGTLNPTPGVFATGVHPIGLAFDGMGDLFEADNSTGSVIEFTNQNGVLNSAPGVFASSLISPLGNGPSGLAVDAAGNLFVSINNVAGTLYKITPNGTKSTFASYQTTVNLDDPAGLVFNSAGNLFVANQAANKSSGDIIEYFPDGGTNNFVSGISQPTCVAFAPTVAMAAVVTNKPMSVRVSEPSPYYTLHPTVVQATTNLLSSWVNIYTNTAPFNFVDPSNSQYRLRFYRAQIGH